MVCNVLSVEKTEAALVQSIDQFHKCYLRCIGNGMKHRFAKKCSVDTDTVESTGQFFIHPDFDRVREPKLMKVDVTRDNFFADPRFSTFAARPNHLFESRIQTNLKLVFFQKSLQSVRH